MPSTNIFSNTNFIDKQNQYRFQKSFYATFGNKFIFNYVGLNPYQNDFLKLNLKSKNPNSPNKLFFSSTLFPVEKEHNEPCIKIRPFENIGFILDENDFQVCSFAKLDGKTPSARHINQDFAQWYVATYVSLLRKYYQLTGVPHLSVSSWNINYDPKKVAAKFLRTWKSFMTRIEKNIKEVMSNPAYPTLVDKVNFLNLLWSTRLYKDKRKQYREFFILNNRKIELHRSFLSSICLDFCGWPIIMPEMQYRMIYDVDKKTFNYKYNEAIAFPENSLNSKVKSLIFYFGPNFQEQTNYIDKATWQNIIQCQQALGLFFLPTFDMSGKLKIHKLSDIMMQFSKVNGIYGFSQGEIYSMQQWENYQYSFIINNICKQNNLNTNLLLNTLRSQYGIHRSDQIFNMLNNYPYIVQQCKNQQFQYNLLQNNNQNANWQLNHGNNIVVNQ